MKRFFMFLTALYVITLPLVADTIYQTNAEGRRGVVQRDAIVIEEDAYTLIYKHFNLADHRVEKVHLNQGSLPYSVETSSPADRRRIVNLWTRFGYTATVTDLAGKTTQVFDAYIDYYPPGGRGSLLEVIPAVTMFPIQLNSGGADVVDFPKIARIDFQNGQIKLTLRSGQVEEGKYLMPTSQPAEARFLGITDRYDPSSLDVFDFSLPLTQAREIRFEP